MEKGKSIAYKDSRLKKWLDSHYSPVDMGGTNINDGTMYLPSSAEVSAGVTGALCCNSAWKHWKIAQEMREALSLKM